MESLGIPTANAWMTVFFTWLMIVAVFLAFHLVAWVLLWAVDRAGSRRKVGGSQSWWVGRLKRNYKFVIMANALRMVRIFTAFSPPGRG